MRHGAEYADLRERAAEMSVAAARRAAERGEHQAAARIFKEAASQYGQASKAHRERDMHTYARQCKSARKSAAADSDYHAARAAEGAPAEDRADGHRAIIGSSLAGPIPLDSDLANALVGAYRSAVSRRGEGALVGPADICRVLRSH